MHIKMIKKITQAIGVLWFGIALTAFAGGGPGEGGDSLAPAAPGGVSAAGSALNISVTWNAVTTNSDTSALTDLSDYRVWRSSDGGSSFQVIATVASGTTSYTDDSSGLGATVYYQITARDATPNESSQSSSSNGAKKVGGGGSIGGSSFTSGDQTPPTNISILINTGQEKTSSIKVTLSLSGTDAVQMLLSNTSNFQGASWKTFNKEIAWELTFGDGVKTVYAKFRDVAGNTTGAISNSITLEGSGVSAPTSVIPTKTPTPAPSAGAPSRISGFQFRAYLKIGNENEDVKKLQELLARDKEIYPSGLVTGYYGGMTKKAVEKFQEKYGIATPGVAGHGSVGPKTQAKLNEILGSTVVATTPILVTTPSAIQVPIGHTFAKRIVLGMQDEDVRKLQEILATDKDVYSEGLVTGYYGALTRKAVERFQEKHGIAKPGDPGYGDVGPGTRAKLNELPQALQSGGEVEVRAKLQAQITALQQQLQDLLSKFSKTPQTKTTQ
ncbi:MAG: peptidoglycan-binding protein [Nanoarchaeota archaeon]|nr:peptidoglycan-binding protein [Nanoarchaeota archaeon]